MELQEFIQLFAEQFDDTPAEVFTGTTKFRELPEWGSLIALSVIAMVDEEFEKRITGADIRGVVTVEELYRLIQSK